MSKPSVGDVYAKVIEEVCAASRVDFEEGGVELAALDLLKTNWQKKISHMNVAQMPWDPKPEPAVAVPSSSKETKVPPTLPSNGHVNSPQSSSSTPGPQIKQDPCASAYPAPQQNNVQYQPPQFASGKPLTAQERAAMHLHQYAGNRAGQQIAQLQQGGQQRVPTQQLPGTYIKREDSGEIPQAPAVPIKASQTDGTVDYEDEVAIRRAQINRNRKAGDKLMRAHFEASQQQLEGGGLLVPLQNRTSRATKAEDGTGNSDASSSSLTRAQGDAAGDDDDDIADEDAINSDLDDPDELDDANEQEDAVGEVMLCTYEKVQRVKNKWKCTLKDGILRVDNKEYVFHKGQGEFEW